MGFKERPRSGKELVDTLFGGRENHIEPLGTPDGHVAIGIFPEPPGRWDSNYISVLGCLRTDKEVVVTSLITKNNGSLRDVKKPINTARAKIGSEIADKDGLDAIMPSKERIGDIVFLHDVLVILAESNKINDPVNSGKANRHLSKVLGEGQDLKNPVISQVATEIVRLDPEE